MNKQNLGSTKMRFVGSVKAKIANQACAIKTQPKLVKKSREYNSKDLTLALYSVDGNKKVFIVDIWMEI